MTSSLYCIYSVWFGVIGDQLIVLYIFRVFWRHWWPSHCTVCSQCGVASFVTGSLYCIYVYSVWCGVIGDYLILLYIFRVVWRHWWPSHCTVYIPCGLASRVTISLYCIYSVWCGFIGDHLIVLYIFRVVWRHWWPAHCTLFIPCGVASLVNISLYRKSSACCGVNGDHLIVLYILCVVWRHWCPAHCTLYIPASCDRWYLSQRFATWIANPLRECPSANMTPCIIQALRNVRLFQAGRQAVYESTIPKLIGSVLAEYWICHHDHRIWSRYSTMCGTIWKLCYRHTRWTPDKNITSESSALPEASVTVQCFARVQVVYSRGSKIYLRIWRTLWTIWMSS